MVRLSVLVQVDGVIWIDNYISVGTMCRDNNVLNLQDFLGKFIKLGGITITLATMFSRLIEVACNEHPRIHVFD